MITNVAERRVFERFPLMLDGSVSIGDHAVTGEILDISAGGAKVRLEERAIVLDTNLVGKVILSLPEFGSFEGTVAWQDDEYIGITFDQPHKTMVYLILEWAENHRREAS